MMFIYMNKLFLRAFLFILILELNWDVNSLSALSNLPIKSDVIVYLKSIERIMEFCASHKNDIDMNLEFGLFLLEVNLRHFMAKKETRLPLYLKANVMRILRANKPLSDFFQFMANNGTDLNHRKDKNITTLFINVNSWVQRTKEYNTVLGKKSDSRKEHLAQKYSSWNVYMGHVSNLRTSRPGPKESDECMLSLSENPMNLREPSYKCVTSEVCSDIVENGTIYGYSLTHRVLYLLAARYGRNCHTFSPQVDDAMIDDLCSTIYEEAQYIALNGYKLADLLMEQICLCTLPGHASFLQRDWLSRLLQLQTPHGCFREDVNPSSSVEAIVVKPWRISKDTDMILGKRCNGHVTAVAAATLGAALRYIVETYYVLT